MALPYPMRRRLSRPRGGRRTRRGHGVAAGGGYWGGAAGVVAPKGRLNFLSAQLVPGAATNLYP